MPITQDNQIHSNRGNAAADEVLNAIRLSPLPAFLAGSDDRVVAANDAFCEMLGLAPADAADSKLYRWLIKTESESGGLNTVVRTSNIPERGEAELRNAAGETLHAQLFARRLEDGSVAVYAIDLAPRLVKEQAAIDAERKRWQSQRIESLARLAGGIAHDFNNFLAVLLLHVDILNLQLKDDDPIRGRVKEIRSIANSVAGTVRQLFAFGRKQPMTLAPSRVNPVVEGFAAHFDAGPNVRLESSLSDDLGMCFVDEVQIINVLKALAENARDAMPDGGTIRFETRNTVVEPAANGSARVQPPGQYVEISVSDTGGGMEPGAEDYVFEPFFATRETEKGAGLALAMVYGIVKQSKGFIWVKTTPDEGTEFRLQFPRIDVQPTESSTPLRTAGERKTVLLVDDEAAVRRITAEFLQMSELDVLQAASGMEALEIAQSHSGPIHLLLTDFSMPLMDGRELAKKVAKLRPETAVLFMSGNIEPEAVGDSEIFGPVNFVNKPFSSAGLTEKVREVLAAREQNN